MTRDDLHDEISSALSYTSAGADCFALTDAILPIVERHTAKAVEAALIAAADDVQGPIKLDANKRAVTLQAVMIAEILAADAWDEGYDAGHQDARAVQATYPEQTRNPYRKAGA